MIHWILSVLVVLAILAFPAAIAALWYLGDITFEAAAIVLLVFTCYAGGS